MQESGRCDRELRAHGEERNRQHGMGARETGGGVGGHASVATELQYGSIQDERQMESLSFRGAR